MGKALDPVEVDATDPKSFLYFLNRAPLDVTSTTSVANILLQLCPVFAKKPQTREERVCTEPRAAGRPSCPRHMYI